MGFTKSKPDIITSQDYKKLNNNVFRSEIQSLSSSEADLGFFKNAIFHIFNNYAPITKKYLPANEAPSNQANKDNYKIQHTLCIKLLRKIKNSYFCNLDTKKSQIIELFEK